MKVLQLRGRKGGVNSSRSITSTVLGEVDLGSENRIKSVCKEAWIRAHIHSRLITGPIPKPARQEDESRGRVRNSKRRRRELEVKSDYAARTRVAEKNFIVSKKKRKIQKDDER